MLQNILNWANVIFAIFGAIVGLIPTLLALRKAIKAKKTAKTIAEEETAYNELREQADILIREAENSFKDIDALLKSNGKSAGVLKKQTVLNSLQQYAFDKGYVFIKDFWSAKIDDIVLFTRNVNGKDAVSEQVHNAEETITA